MKIHTCPGIQALGYLALLGLFGYGLSILVVSHPMGESLPVLIRSGLLCNTVHTIGSPPA